MVTKTTYPFPVWYWKLANKAKKGISASKGYSSWGGFYKACPALGKNIEQVFEAFHVVFVDSSVAPNSQRVCSGGFDVNNDGFILHLHDLCPLKHTLTSLDVVKNVGQYYMVLDGDEVVPLHLTEFVQSHWTDPAPQKFKDDIKGVCKQLSGPLQQRPYNFREDQCMVCYERDFHYRCDMAEPPFKREERVLTLSYGNGHLFKHNESVMVGRVSLPNSWDANQVDLAMLFVEHMSTSRCENGSLHTLHHFLFPNNCVHPTIFGTVSAGTFYGYESCLAQSLLALCALATHKTIAKSLLTFFKSGGPKDRYFVLDKWREYLDIF